MFKNKVSLYFHTLRYLKLRQIIYQLYYKFKKTSFYLKTVNFEDIQQLDLLAPAYPYGKVSREGEILSFKFLNKEKSFKSSIDWDCTDYGKLWTYNLNYFDFLSDPQISDEDKQWLIKDFIHHFDDCNNGKEPYTISLRAYNWVKYLSSFSTFMGKEVYDHLYSQYELLLSRLEYHLLANHLFENALSLLFGAYFFSDERFYKKAKILLKSQLNEQINVDGSHFERSVMYHSILLGRMIEATFLVKNNHQFMDDSFENFLASKTSLMLAYLQKVSFSSGDIPMFNDAVRKSTLPSSTLQDMAYKAEIKIIDVELSDCGLRKLGDDDFELIADIGNIAPSYQPGHAHACIGAFELKYKQKDIIVDVGTSTYEDNEIRHFERSTAAHNTVVFNDCNQSAVWSAFRVGKRAKCTLVNDTSSEISFSHDGYLPYKEHQRNFKIQNNVLTVIDQVIGSSNEKAFAYFHFSPQVEVELIKEHCFRIGELEISFSGCCSVELESFNFAKSFNVIERAPLLKVEFAETLRTIIYPL